MGYLRIDQELACKSRMYSENLRLDGADVRYGVIPKLSGLGAGFYGCEIGGIECSSLRSSDASVGAFGFDFGSACTCSLKCMRAILSKCEIFLWLWRE
jgi:hypothetical protein